jgi:hypothetical protein
MRYLTMLWLIGYLPYLYKRLALEHELSAVHIPPNRESALGRARRISKEVQDDPFRFEPSLVWVPGTKQK